MTYLEPIIFFLILFYNGSILLIKILITRITIVRECVYIQYIRIYIYIYINLSFLSA
jgi:hypothetical protein